MNLWVRDLKVLNSIVCTVAVFVVNIFISMELSAKMLFHNYAMEPYKFSADPLDQIAMAKGRLPPMQKKYPRVTMLIPSLPM